MFLLNCLLIFLVVLQNISTSATAHKAVLRGSCVSLADQKLTLACTALYPRDVRIRYLDDMVTPAMRYAVFTIDGMEQHFLISHGYSQIFECVKMSVLSPKLMKCQEETSIEMDDAIMHCLPFHATIADELVDHCMGNEKPKTKAAFVAMHYVDAGRHTKGIGVGRRRPISGSLLIDLLAILWIL